MTMLVIVLIMLSSLGWLMSVVAVMSLSGVGVWTVLGIWLCLIAVFGVTLRRAMVAGSGAAARLQQELATDLEALAEWDRGANAAGRDGAARRI